MQSYGAMTLLQAQKKQREHSFLQLLLLLLNLLSCHFINERKTNEKKKESGGVGERQMQTVRRTTISQYRERPMLRVTLLTDRHRQREKQQYRNIEKDRD